MASIAYKFTARSRKDMEAYILNRKSHHGPFAWNVKAYHVDYDHPKGDYELDSQFDAAWAAKIQREDHTVNFAFEDAQRMYADGEYTTYPGDDQGDWEFSFEGRSGGWLVLQKWCDRDMTNFQDYDLEDFSYEEVRKLYRALVCMDHDFTPAKASEEVEAQLNFIRFNWEEERRQEQAEKVLAQAESYADHPLYNGIYEAKAV